MRFAIVESGGKQYRAVEGSTIEVDRLPVEPGKKFELERVLLMADGDDALIGTPLLSDILVKATVVDHFKGPKLVRFKYRPKKRIRVKGGHRSQLTRLMIDFIGKPGEERKVEKPAKQEAPVEVAEAEQESKAAKQTKGPKKEPAKPSAKKTERAPATSSPKGKKSTTSKTSSKKTGKK